MTYFIKKIVLKNISLKEIFLTFWSLHLRHTNLTQKRAGVVREYSKRVRFVKMQFNLGLSLSFYLILFGVL